MGEGRKEKEMNGRGQEDINEERTEAAPEEGWGRERGMTKKKKRDDEWEGGGEV